MTFINNSFVKQYTWYYKKLNSCFLKKTIPILFINGEYVACLVKNIDEKILKCTNVHTHSMDNKIYHICSFANTIHDEVIDILKEHYNIVYIDVDSEFIWKIRDPNESKKYIIFTDIISNLCTK